MALDQLTATCSRPAGCTHSLDSPHHSAMGDPTGQPTGTRRFVD